MYRALPPNLQALSDRNAKPHGEGGRTPEEPPTFLFSRLEFVFILLDGSDSDADGNEPNQD